LIPAILLLSLYHFSFHFFGATSPHWEELGWVREYGGLMAFSVSIASVVLYMVYRLMNVAKTHPT
jgi:hypothetical protein